MADRHTITEIISEGVPFDETFMLAEKELRTTRAGKLFISGTLQDKTGSCRMIIWEATENFYEALPRGGFVRAKGRLELYQNRPQMVVEACIPVSEDEIDLADFMPSTTEDVDALEAELRDHLGRIEDAGLRALADAFMEDEAMVAGLRRSPAAKVNHHAYVGGLLEHTVSMLRVAEHVAPLYPVLNRDLLTLGIFLHDIGKTVELSSDRTFEYTTGGRLVGHLVQGALMVAEKIRALRGDDVDLDELLEQQLIHLILAHHGEYEFGSPKLPMTAEAVALNYIDNLDAKLNAFTRAVADHPAEDEDWTGRQFMFDNQMLFRGTEADRQRLREALGTPADTGTSHRPERRGGID